MTLNERGRKAGLASAQQRRIAAIEKTWEMVTEHNTEDPQENERNTVRNCEIYRDIKAAMSAAAAALFFVSSVVATISPGQPDKLVWGPSPAPVVHYLVSIGPDPTNRTIIFSTPIASTNFVMTNLPPGFYWAEVRAVTTNGIQSDPTPTINWTNTPDPPIFLRIQSSTNASLIISLPLPFGTTAIESAPDASGPWTTFATLGNVSPDPIRELMFRLNVDDPRKIFRAVVSPAMLAVRKPPSP